MSFLVTNLNDSGHGSFRQALIDSNLTSGTVINFTVSGTIKVLSDLPLIVSNVTIDGTSVPNYLNIPSIVINCNNHSGLSFYTGNSQILAIKIKNSSKNGIFVCGNNNLIDKCIITKNMKNGISIHGNNNIIGTNSLNISNYSSNIISKNCKNGISIKGNNNLIVKNEIVKNKENGIFIQGKKNVIGGTVYTNSNNQTNNPTGTYNTVTPVFIIPPLGNNISKNSSNGVYLFKANENRFSGNFIGTSKDGNSSNGNKKNGIYLNESNYNIFKGCDIGQNPFVYYNVVSGNELNGFYIHNSNGNVIEGNFAGLSANNSVAIPNGKNGLFLDGDSKDTNVGGIIPLGNNFSGNNSNGIKLSEKVSNFLSFNSFCGLASFGGAVPNKKNGIKITSSGLNNQIRTNVLSGNLRNGLELSGEATQVNCDPNLCGTDTNGTAALPNGMNGLLISGNANNNFIGSQIKSVIPTSVFSSNKLAGIHITENAHDNVIYDCSVGLNVLHTEQLSNGTYSILIDKNVKQNCIIDNYLDGDLLLKDFCSNNKLIVNTLKSETKIINNSKYFNLIVTK